MNIVFFYASTGKECCNRSGIFCICPCLHLINYCTQINLKVPLYILVWFSIPSTNITFQVLASLDNTRLHLMNSKKVTMHQKLHPSWMIDPILRLICSEVLFATISSKTDNVFFTVFVYILEMEGCFITDRVSSYLTQITGHNFFITIYAQS